jgi:hypothetical protein
MAQLLGFSITYRIAVGPQAWQGRRLHRGSGGDPENTRSPEAKGRSKRVQPVA